MLDIELVTYEVDRGYENDRVDGGKLFAGGGTVLHLDADHAAQQTNNLGVRQHLGQTHSGLVIFVS